MSRPTLERRFHSFLSQLHGAENIDETFKSSELLPGKRADFLLNGRQIVLEMKSLEADPESKVHERLSSLQSRPDYPVFYWESDLREILSHLHDGDTIRREIGESVTRRVQKLIAASDDQLGATRESLNLDEAAGITVILNETIGILEPHIITAAASKILLKEAGAEYRYKHVHYVWIVSEAHSIRFDSATECLPMVILEGPLAEGYSAQGVYLSGLLQEWSKFEGMPLQAVVDLEGLGDLSFNRRTAQPLNEDVGLTNHEVLKLAYRQNPYLRKLSEDVFIRHASDIIKMLAPSLLVGGKKQPKQTVMTLQKLFTDVLEEAEYRRLDMRKVMQRYNKSTDERTKR